jgi:hypothetical protein
MALSLYTNTTIISFVNTRTSTEVLMTPPRPKYCISGDWSDSPPSSLPPLPTLTAVMGYILFLKIQAAVARKKRDLSPDFWQLIESLDLLVMKGKLIFS